MNGSAKAVEVLGVYIAQLEQQVAQSQQIISNQQAQIDEFKKQAPASVDDPTASP